MPVVSPEHLAALKTRLDLLEKNISALIEQKMAVPAPASKQVSDLVSRFDLLEKKLETELLKIFEESQKSSKHDLRPYDQFEKSCLRLQELGNKLEGVCKISTETQSKADAENKARADVMAEFARNTASLEKGFSELRGFIGTHRIKEESALKESASSFNNRAEELGTKIGNFNNLIKTLYSRGEETEKSLSITGAKMDKVSEVLDRIDPEKYNVHLKSLHRELSGIRLAFKEQSDRFWGKSLDLNMIAEDFKVRSKTMETEIEKAVNGNKELMAAALDNIGAIVDRALARFMADLQEKNRDQFAQLSLSYDRALGALNQVAFVCSSIEGVSKRLGRYENTLKNFMVKVGGDRLAALTGVSGIVVRENFGAINAMAADFGREKEYLEAASKEISDKCRDVIRREDGNIL